jgi:hypothetical protein
MPLDFNTTKRFRDFVLSKTLQVPNGPQTFTENDYRYKNLNESANVDPGAVDTNRNADLLQSQNSNIFKPLTYNITEQLNVIPRRANLSLYYDGTPYFVSGNHNLVSIIANDNYENESELFKFAASYIKDRTKKGPVYARLEQNLNAATVGRVRLLDALQGNLATAVNIVTGKEPLVESNYRITVAKTPIGKGVDFLQTVGGVEFPWVEIPGDYLTNPLNPTNVRPVPNTEFGKVFQDATAALGSLLGIRRRPEKSRKPSDLFVDYMGSGQKQVLFDLLSYSKYAPNYTTTARSQNTSKLFNFVDKFAQSAKNILGIEAPNTFAYIGDDRGDDVKYAMNDFFDRPVRSPYYLSLKFDSVQTKLFENKKNITDGGQISGKLTWISRNSKNKLGENNSEFGGQRSQLEDSLSTNHDFREDSILGITQDILDGLPTNGGEGRSHIANVIDQTTKIFREGNFYLSKGSAIKYVDKFGEESGVEYCRTWTKDRPYISYSDTMKKGGNIRKFEGTIVSDPWNLNIAPMSNGKKGFEGSTNIFKAETNDSNSFYAKKYMFSIENLAWKTSNKKGFTVLDLPFCERGPNGGRIMWFPPYDIKVSENNQASWESNKFLGRPEPVYTYSNTERTGQLAFKIVVDHPSILNLLTREYFKNMSDEEADNYINAVFAGCEELDFYDLIRRFTTLDKSDIENILAYLNDGLVKTEIPKYKVTVSEVTQAAPETTTTNVPPTQAPTENNTTPKTEFAPSVTLHFNNDIPGTKTNIKTSSDYSQLYSDYYNKKSEYATVLQNSLQQLNGFPLRDTDAYNDRIIIYGSNITGTTQQITDQVNKINTYFEDLKKSYETFTGNTKTLRDNLEKTQVKTINVNINASTSSPSAVDYNKRLSMRRSYSVMLDFLKRISKDNKEPSTIKWFDASTQIGNELSVLSSSFTYDIKDLGWGGEGKININVKNFGETYNTINPNERDKQCFGKDFKKVKDLNIYAPIQFYCRKASIDFYYDVTESKKAEPINPEPPKVLPTVKKTKLEPDGTLSSESKVKKPPIDVMKRIIMKTLSECFYFKKLESDSPLVFKSLREKLRYFHPAFHSTTPEGLNARLTFIHQCLRPGDTIPIKGVSDESDLNARNTTFGPPPICVLRIGDFYHSKVIIRDAQISFDESPWDMNPEGIGYQPMIASVQLSLSFIGGHGLETPVSQLQNALSSNFYANTEIYDERSIPTNTMIGGQTASGFTKEFLQRLVEANNVTPEQKNQDNNTIAQGKYIGTLEGNNLNYTKLIDDVFSATQKYYLEYEKFYNTIVQEYGEDLSSIVFSERYRDVYNYETWKGNNTSENIKLFGLYSKGSDLGNLLKKAEVIIKTKIDDANLVQMFSFDKDLPPKLNDKTNRLLKTHVTKVVVQKISDLLNEKPIKDFELNRNDLIKSLDPLNFVVKYERDFKINNSKFYEIELSGFTRDKLYDEYSYCIDYIKSNNKINPSAINTAINFKFPDMTSITIDNILANLLQDEKENILNLFKSDSVNYTQGIIKSFNKRLDNFIKKPASKTFKFSTFKPKKNSNTISFSILTETETTNDTMKDDGQKLNMTIVDYKNKLNYYKLNIATKK